MKTVFLIGGMSESGKSTVGKYLDSKGVKRLKFTTFFGKVMEKERVNGDFQQWNEQTEKERPDWLHQRFAEEFAAELQKKGIEYCCVESLYNPKFGEFLRRVLPYQVVIVYVEIPLQIRLERQVIRQNLGSIEEAKDYLLPRDQRKEEWGTPKIREIADVVIDNSGSLEELYRKTDEMIAKYTSR